MKTVGILGGGQLARMMALSAAPLGLRFLVLDTAADACAGQFAPMVVGDYTDQNALAEFASKIDVATFDFENVPAESAQWLAGRVPVFPSPRALGVALSLIHIWIRVQPVSRASRSCASVSTSTISGNSGCISRARAMAAATEPNARMWFSFSITVS